MPEVLEKGAAFSTTNITVTTTTEQVAISSGRVPIPTATCRAVVRAWCQLTLGTATTTVTPRIRRGTAITDPVVGEANPEQIKTAAGSTEPYMIQVEESLQDRESVEYSFTVQQAAATANGTVLQAHIEVEILNG